MEFQEVVRRRRMVRAFDPNRAVPGDVLDRILENALHAPSAGFSQGWAFVVLEGREETDRFWRHIAEDGWSATGRGTGLTAAPVLILPLAHKQAYLDRYSQPDKAATGMDVEENWPVPYWHIDVGFASLLMLLTVVDAGLGAVFFGIPWPDRERALLDELGVPDAFKPIGVIALGYRAPDTPSPSLRRGRRPVSEVVHRGRW